MTSTETNGSLMVQCPSCNKRFKNCDINAHVNRCLDFDSDSNDIVIVDNTDDAAVTTGRSQKRKLDAAGSSSHSSASSGWGFLMPNLDQSNKVKKMKTKQASLNNNNNNNLSETKTINITEENTSSRTSVAESEETTKTRAHTDDQNGCTVDLFAMKQPLAEEMRPDSLDSYIGQHSAVGRNTLLWTLLQRDTVPSMLLWGPPGCGKTTLAKIVANRCRSKMKFVQLSATSSGVGDVKEVIKNAKNNYRTFKKRTILFLDEVHRFNKIQQDSLLPHVEDGTITLIGATTENPSFQVNTALLSRCKVIVLDKLDSESLQRILMRAVEKLGFHVSGDPDSNQQSESDKNVCIEKKALEVLSLMCDGDARVALNGLQMTVQSVMSKCSQSQGVSQTERLVVTVDDVKQGLQRTHIAYDKTGEEHYNCASAIHKSMRGSDSSAALYWLARMLEGGETPLFVARRLVAFASEDIGLADNQALSLAVSTYQACHFLGMPECEKVLAHCVVYLARAPKSVEVFTAYTRAKECVKQHQGPLPGVPLHLRNASTKLMKDMGYGKGYKYNPAFSEPVDQTYFPEGLVGTDFFK